MEGAEWGGWDKRSDRVARWFYLRILRSGRQTGMMTQFEKKLSPEDSGSTG